MIYLDPTRRSEAIDAGWEAYCERIPLMEGAYRRTCEAWDVIAVVADRVIGALFAKDGVIHLGIIPEWRGRWASRRLIREMLTYGKKTKIMPGESWPREFIGRIGFVPTGDHFTFQEVA